MRILHFKLKFVELKIKYAKQTLRNRTIKMVDFFIENEYLAGLLFRINKTTFINVMMRLSQLNSGVRTRSKDKIDKYIYLMQKIYSNNPY